MMKKIEKLMKMMMVKVSLTSAGDLNVGLNIVVLAIIDNDNDDNDDDDDGYDDGKAGR